MRDSVRQVEDLCQGQEICSVQTGFALLGGSRGDRCPRVRYSNDVPPGGKYKGGGVFKLSPILKSYDCHEYPD